MTLDDIGLSKKLFVPVIMTAVAIFALTAVSAVRLDDIATTANDLIARRNVVAVTMARSMRALSQANDYALAALAYDGDSPIGKKANDDFSKTFASSLDLLEKGADLLPEGAEYIRKIEERVKAVGPILDEQFKIGRQAPGLERGRALKPEDLDIMAKGAALGEVGLTVESIVADTVAFNNRLLAENAQRAT